MDIQQCYPPASYAPYWFIIIGFIISAAIQIATFNTGNGIISYIKGCLTCQGCRTIKYDMEATKEWNVNKPPKRINIAPDSMAAAVSQKNSKSAAFYFGNYSLKYDNTNNILYKSDFQSKHNKTHYIFKFINQPQYEGWVVIEDGAERFKFDMIHIAESTDTAQETIIDTKEDEMEMEEIKTNELHRIAVSTIDDDAHPLSLLDFNNHKFKAFPPLKIQITSHNIAMSPFLSRITNFDQGKLQFMGIPPSYRFVTQQMFNFNIRAHWIQFRGLKGYKHNVLNGNHGIFDINGRYTLVNVEDNSQFGFIKYTFLHQYYELDVRLRCFYTINVFNMQNILFVKNVWIDIKHELIGKLAEFEYDILSNPDIETMPYHPKNFECAHFGHCHDPNWPWDTNKRIECKQYVFDKPVELILRVKENNGCKYHAGLMVMLILILMVIYQFIMDILALANYNEKRNIFVYYECYAFIITNSANMKQFCIFILCTMIVGDEFADRKIMAFTGAWFYKMAKIYFILFVPVLLTHVIPFIFFYCLWMVVCYVCCIRRNNDNDGENGDGNDEQNDLNELQKLFKTDIGKMLFGLACYFLLILFPVSTMSRLYHSDFGGQAYIDSFVDVFSDRKTSHMFLHYEELWKSITQFVMWIF